MEEILYEKVVKKYYDALDEGRILGRRCPKCGHVEFPPYLACNECGNYEGMEWVETSGRGEVTCLVPCPMIFQDPFFQQATGGNYVLASVRPEGSDECSVPLLGVTPEQVPALEPLLPLPVKAVIFQDNGYKFVAWELADAAATDVAPADGVTDAAAPDTVAEAQVAAGALSPLEEKVLGCVAEAYAVDADGLNLDTDIRAELSNVSMKLLMLISTIEDELDVSITMAEVAKLRTIGDFARRVEELAG